MLSVQHVPHHYPLQPGAGSESIVMHWTGSSVVHSASFHHLIALIECKTKTHTQKKTTLPSVKTQLTWPLLDHCFSVSILRWSEAICNARALVL